MSLFHRLICVPSILPVVPQSEIRVNFGAVNFKRLATNALAQIFILKFPGIMAARNFT